MKEQRFVGKWWVPSNENRQIGGVLTVDVDGHSELELVDELIDEDDPVAMVYGAAQGRDITLLDVMSKGTSRVFAQNVSAVERSQPGAVIVGFHLESPTQEVFDHIDVQISNLTTWARDTSIEETTTFTEHEDGMTIVSDEIKITPPEAVFARLDAHEVDVAMRRVVRRSGTKERAWARSLDIQEEVTLRISANSPRSWDGFTPTLLAFRDLITLAVQSGSVIGARKLLIDIADRPTPYVVDLYVNGGGEVSDARRHRDLLFDLRDVDFETVINRWVAIRTQIGLPLDVLLGLDYIKTGYYENRLFNAASAGEGFHTGLYPDSKQLTTEQHAAIKARVAEVFEGDDLTWVKQQVSWNRLGLKDRYMELAGHADQKAVTALLTDAETWARWLKNARNSIGHVDTDALAKAVPDSARFLLTDITRAFLHLVLLQELGLDPELQRRAVDNLYTFRAGQFREAVDKDIASRP
ncbi:HEPN domain-containing protein [Rhodococcus sp. 077-4]|uniref:ApeA N-terminal domain 1-containing protein n=1 Tax=Rhodococcus sp. 077-4 TaxID=2789271 RepID=UPI0039F4ACBA